MSVDGRFRTSSVRTLFLVGWGVPPMMFLVTTGATMKKTLFALALAACGHAMAAGPYDGIYADAAAPNSYISVHTNGDRVIATSYEILPASGIVFTSEIGSVMPRQVNVWQLLQGIISGSNASLSGQLMFNQCNVQISASFTGTGLVAYITRSTSSGAGSSSTMNCQALVSSLPIRFNKIF